MSKVKKKAIIGKDCVACGSCVNVCPVGAVSMFKGLTAVVNYQKCIGCGKCRLTCPAGVVEIVKREAEDA